MIFLFQGHRLTIQNRFTSGFGSRFDLQCYYCHHFNFIEIGSKVYLHLSKFGRHYIDSSVVSDPLRHEYHVRHLKKKLVKKKSENALKDVIG